MNFERKCFDISHSITKPLRHYTKFRGLNHETGWTNLKDLYIYINTDFKWEEFIEIIIAICNPTDVTQKIRFQIDTEGYVNNWQIRALQGHSIKSIKINDHEVVTDLSIKLVHGTPMINIKSIRETGLMRFGRNHIHFCSVAAPTLMRHMKDRKAEVYLFITVKKLLENGFEVMRSPNNVYLVCTDCIPYDLFEESTNL